MHQIDKALNKRGNRIVSIVDPIIAEKREANAFLNGFVMGVTVSHTQPVNNPEKVTVAAQEPRREVEGAWGYASRFIAILSILVAVAGACLAIGWHTADARWQDELIIPIVEAKKAGELPPPIPQIGEYDRIKGVRK